MDICVNCRCFIRVSEYNGQLFCDNCLRYVQMQEAMYYEYMAQQYDSRRNPRQRQQQPKQQQYQQNPRQPPNGLYYPPVQSVQLVAPQSAPVHIEAKVEPKVEANSDAIVKPNPLSDTEKVFFAFTDPKTEVKIAESSKTEVETEVKIAESSKIEVVTEIKIAESAKTEVETEVKIAESAKTEVETEVKIAESENKITESPKTEVEPENKITESSKIEDESEIITETNVMKFESPKTEIESPKTEVESIINTGPPKTEAESVIKNEINTDLPKKTILDIIGEWIILFYLLILSFMKNNQNVDAVHVEQKDNECVEIQNTVHNGVGPTKKVDETPTKKVDELPTKKIDESETHEINNEIIIHKKYEYNYFSKGGKMICNDNCKSLKKIN